VLLLGFLVADAAVSSERPPHLYAMTTETLMPHLEENLRYAIRNEPACLDGPGLATAFWMLRDVSLQDCTLESADEADDTASYALVCRGGHGTTGHATWQFGANQITGVLEVKLGGKNMTFSQRIVARPIGECDAR